MSLKDILMPEELLYSMYKNEVSCMSKITVGIKFVADNIADDGVIYSELVANALEEHVQFLRRGGGTTKAGSHKTKTGEITWTALIEHDISSVPVAKMKTDWGHMTDSQKEFYKRDDAKDASKWNMVYSQKPESVINYRKEAQKQKALNIKMCNRVTNVMSKALLASCGTVKAGVLEDMPYDEILSLTGVKPEADIREEYYKSAGKFLAEVANKEFLKSLNVKDKKEFKKIWNKEEFGKSDIPSKKVIDKAVDLAERKLASNPDDVFGRVIEIVDGVVVNREVLKPDTIIDIAMLTTGLDGPVKNYGSLDPDQPLIVKKC